VALDEALDQLYGAALAEFVTLRKELAAQLKAAGDADDAKELAKARRPTTAAWALNQLAREEPQLVDAVIDAGDQVRRAQEDAAPGQADALRETAAARRRIVSDAADAAVQIATRSGAKGDAHRDALVAALDAASINPELGPALRAGRLVRESTGAIGFPDFELGGTSPPRRPALRVVPQPEPPKQPSPTVEEARARRARELEEAEEAAREATERASSARARADEADTVVAQLERELEELTARVRTAKSEAHDARKFARDLERRAERAERTVDALRDR
jgi:hypothetical protein